MEEEEEEEQEEEEEERWRPIERQGIRQQKYTPFRGCGSNSHSALLYIKRRNMGSVQLKPGPASHSGPSYDDLRSGMGPLRNTYHILDR